MEVLIENQIIISEQIDNKVQYIRNNSFPVLVAKIDEKKFFLFYLDEYKTYLWYTEEEIKNYNKELLILNSDDDFKEKALNYSYYFDFGFDFGKNLI